MKLSAQPNLDDAVVDHGGVALGADGGAQGSHLQVHLLQASPTQSTARVRSEERRLS